jgi:hypothetical protein
MALILSTICPTASHNVPAVVLAGEADLVENEGVLHRGLATRIRGAGDRDVACRRPPVTAASAGGAGCGTSKFLTIPQAGKRSSATMLAVVGADYGQRIMAYCIHAPLTGLSYSWPDDAIKLRRRELLLVLVGASR